MAQFGTAVEEILSSLRQAEPELFDLYPEHLFGQKAEETLWAFQQAFLNPSEFHRHSKEGLPTFVKEQVVDDVDLEVRHSRLWTIRHRVRIVFHNPSENRSYREIARFRNKHFRIQPAPLYDKLNWNAHSCRETWKYRQETDFRAACRGLEEEWGKYGLTFDESQLQSINFLNSRPAGKAESEVYFSTMSEHHDRWFHLTTDYSCAGEFPHGQKTIQDGNTWIVLESFEYDGTLLGIKDAFDEPTALY